MVEADKVESVINELYKREIAYESACQDAAEAEHAYKLALATEFGKAGGSVDVRKNLALIACGELYKAHLTADAVRDFTKVKVMDCQQILSARQSILSSATKTNFGYANSRTTT